MVIVGHQSFIKLQCEEKLCSFSALVNLSLLFQVSAVLYLREFICNNGDNLGLASKFHFMKHQINKNLCKKWSFCTTIEIYFLIALMIISIEICSTLITMKLLFSQPKLDTKYHVKSLPISNIIEIGCWEI